MSEIIKRDGGDEGEASVRLIGRYQALQAGQYWRALRAIHHQGIDEGTVLLIQSIRWVDDEAHTVVLRPHPSKIGTTATLLIPQENGGVSESLFSYAEHRFLLKEFLEMFCHEPDYCDVRAREVQAAQEKIACLQTELLEAQSNPSLLARVVNERLGSQQEQDSPLDGEAKSPVSMSLTNSRFGLMQVANNSLADVIGAGITSESVAAFRQAAGREHEIATIKSEWIQSKTKEIADTIRALTPFYEEQSAAALAQTEDVRAYVEKMMEGIQSLDLYVGKDVEVTTIREGEGAPRDQPLTFVQRKLMMDEELAVWADIDDWFDFSKEHLFFEALCEHDSLVRQIFPTERCVLVMAVTRRYIDYGDKWENVNRNEENRKVFLMVRNGMNIYRVFSPVESHLGSARLFPSLNEQESVFRGVDGRQIKFEDVAYTDHLAKHEKFALHYKRFLLLACGLDHRLKLFGDFYEGPASLNFVSLDFQERYCRFLHDDDGTGMLSGEKRIDLYEWIAEKNDYLKSGSRVLCNWRAVMNPRTAPAACKYVGDPYSFERLYRPDNDMGVALVYRSGRALCVDVAVSGETSNWKKRRFNCKVNLSDFDDGYWGSDEHNYLCLDAVYPEELNWYIHNRDTRSRHLLSIRFLKTALKYLQQEFDGEQDTRERLARVLVDGGLARENEAFALVQKTVIAWRAANRGRALPKFKDASDPEWNALLDQVRMLAGVGRCQAESVAEFVRSLGYEPLRLVLSGKTNLAIYAEPSLEEMDNRVEQHPWVHRINIKKNKVGYVERSRRWEILPKAIASEPTLYEWPRACEWSGKSSLFHDFKNKQKLFSVASGFLRRLDSFSSLVFDVKEFDREFNLWKEARTALLSKSRLVSNPDFAMPFGLVYYPRSKELRFLCVGSLEPHAVLYKLAPNQVSRDLIRCCFVKEYANKVYADDLFQRDVESCKSWQLIEAHVKLEDICFESYLVESARTACGRKQSDSLVKWFDSWKEDAKQSGAIYWISEDVLDDMGNLMFDCLPDLTI